MCVSRYAGMFVHASDVWPRLTVGFFLFFYLVLKLGFSLKLKLAFYIEIVILKAKKFTCLCPPASGFQDLAAFLTFMCWLYLISSPPKAYSTSSYLLISLPSCPFPIASFRYILDLMDFPCKRIDCYVVPKSSESQD